MRNFCSDYLTFSWWVNFRLCKLHQNIRKESLSNKNPQTKNSDLKSLQI